MNDTQQLKPQYEEVLKKLDNKINARLVAAQARREEIKDEEIPENQNSGVNVVVAPPLSRWGKIKEISASFINRWR